MDGMIPISTMLEMTQRYRPKELEIIYDPDFDGEEYKNRVVQLYKKADRLNDWVVLNILVEKYDMASIMSFDYSGLPESTLEEANQSFEEIYEFIKKIVPTYEVSKMKHRNYARKNMGQVRQVGGRHMRTCFTTDKDGNPIFHIRKYLFITNSDNVRKIATKLDCPKDIWCGLITDLIEWCCKQEKIKEATLELLMTFPDTESMPIEDVSDMLVGLTQISVY